MVEGFSDEEMRLLVVCLRRLIENTSKEKIAPADSRTLDEVRKSSPLTNGSDHLMRHATLSIVCSVLLALCNPSTDAQDKTTSLTSAPKGYDAKRDGIDRGKMEVIEYESKVGRANAR